MTWHEEWNSARPVERTVFVFVALAALLNILLTLLNYPVIGHDAYVHLNWLYQFPRLVSQGILYPRWLPDSFGGFGSPTFYFYPPLPYWLASFFYSIGIHSFQGLYQTLQFVFSICSLGTSYVLLKQFCTTRLRALTGALVYSFLAYRFCDVFIRDALTEHAALAFVPLLFLQSRDRWRSIVIHTVGWAGLLLTNLPIAYLSIVAEIITTIARKSWKDIPIHGSSFILAIASSAAYLFPAFGLRELIHQRHLFDLPMHTSTWGFALLDLAQGHFDWLRILSVAVIIAAVLVLIRWKEVQAAWKWILAVGIFIQVPLIAAPVWHIVPGMPFVQFAFRWNGILLLAIASIFAREGTKSSLLSCAIIGLSIVTSISAITISRNIFRRPPLPITNYLNDAPEYAPKWASDDPGEVTGISLRRMSDPPAILLGLTAPSDSISLERRTPIEWDLAVRLERQTPVRFHEWYWPYWVLYRDSALIPLAPDVNGFATADLPAGNYTLRLRLERSRVEEVGTRVSTIGIVFFFILLLNSIYRSITKRRERTSDPAETRRI